MNHKLYGNIDVKTFDNYITELAILPLKFNRIHRSALGANKTRVLFQDMRIAVIYTIAAPFYLKYMATPCA